MTITIHKADGGCSCHEGIADHLKAETVLGQLGYAIFRPDTIPPGSYGPGRLVCIRQEEREYTAAEYDVAEIDE